MNDVQSPHEKMNPYGDVESRLQRDNDDQIFFKRLESLIGRSGMSFSDTITQFSAFVRRRELARLLAHYELFQHIRTLPGSIVELGVYRGAGMMTWHHFLELFCPADHNRRVYGFDHFDGYQQARETEPSLAPWIDGVLGTMIGDEDFVQELLAIQNSDNFLHSVERSHLIAGDIHNTLPQFIDDNPGLRLSLVYFDMGTYDATLCALKHLYSKIVTGGLLVFNGYGMKPWEGETQAVDDFFASRGGTPAMEKFTCSTIPHGWFKKSAQAHLEKP